GRLLRDDTARDAIADRDDNRAHGRCPRDRMGHLGTVGTGGTEGPAPGRPGGVVLTMRQWAGGTAWIGRIAAAARDSLPSRVGRAGTAVPLAWRNMLADKRRLLRSTSGIAFAALLMLLQLGFRGAFLDSALGVIQNIDGDILLTS